MAVGDRVGAARNARANPQTENSNSQAYYRIPVNLYQDGDIIEEDLFFLYQGNYLLFRLKNLIWKEEDRLKLEEFGIRNLYIEAKTPRSHQEFLENHLSKILEEALIPSKEKAEILYSTSVSLIEDIFEASPTPDKLKRSMKAVKSSIDYLHKDRNNFFELMSLARQNFTEYTHALHTAAYSICLGQYLGIRAFNQASALGIGAILHDIGKVKIDLKILNKEGKLDENERLEVEKHPIYGYELVHRMGTIPEISEKIILEHHERPDGKGYPRHLTGELSQMTRIVCLADCFDSLTSERPYSKAMKPLEAVQYMRESLKDEYDRELIVNFIKMLKR